ncbi:MAG TPA: RecX family transcriptional regulator [Chloroflexota bacterium]|nr:RecX family transcriptional regulator [Chloroflexota bacterium]
MADGERRGPHEGASEADSGQPAPPARALSGEVTGLEAQVRHPGRVNLYLDGRFAFGLDAEVAAEVGLRVGDVLSEQGVAELLQREAQQTAMQQALHLLSYRPRSEQELRRHLGQKGHAPETVEAVLSRLREFHYLDDSVFALSWVENRQRFRPRGARLLRAELRQKGVAPEVTEQAIEDAAGDERAMALEAAQRKLAGIRAADYQTFGRQLGGFLMRRGFAPDVVWEVVRELWARRSGERAPLADE